MNKLILNTGIQEFICNNLHTDIVSVILKKSKFPGVTSKEIAEQIKSKKKCQKKLPTWFNSTKIYHPNSLNIEQCSSEKTAAYKSEIISGKSLVDLTGGLGVDSYYFSKKISSVFHCEMNAELSNIAAYNFQILDTKNIQTYTSDGIEFLKKTDAFYDWIFVDPSRRDNTKRKVFLLEDCLPNVVDNLSLFFEKSKNIMIKTSPLLDLSIGIKKLKQVNEIHIVAINNEVKELLWILNTQNIDEIKIKTINIKKDNVESYDFIKSEETGTTLHLSQPLNYLYSPNAAILKGGIFKSITSKFNVTKLHEHTHLYTSKKLIEFPGKTFQIKKVTPFNKKEMLRLKGCQVNVATRNFPVTVKELRNKFQLKDGGNNHLFFAKDHIDDKIIIHCIKIK